MSAPIGRKSKSERTTYSGRKLNFYKLLPGPHLPDASRLLKATFYNFRKLGEKLTAKQEES
jgi:hypothetical protein